MTVSSGFTRRGLLMGAALAAAGRGQAKASYAYAGSFTTAKRNGRGDGIHVYRVDPSTGEWRHAQHVGGLVNPSFLAMSRDGRFLYSSHADEEYATAFAIERESGEIRKLNQAATGGVNGAHLALAPGGRFLAVANYASGSVAVLPVREDGTLGDKVQVAALEGKPGPHRAEQASSHPHQVVFDPSGRYLAVPDKGLDRIFVFAFDGASGKLEGRGSAATRAGAGPRHIAFHPSLPVAWVINELDSTTTTYRWDAGDGSLRAVQRLPSLPPEFTADSTGAEITASADGRFVYASNRGHDSVVTYATDARTGLLTAAAWTPTQGRVPRFITLDRAGRFLYAANEQGDSIVAFRVDRKTGRLETTGATVKMATPVTIVFTAP